MRVCGGVLIAGNGVRGDVSNVVVWKQVWPLERCHVCSRSIEVW